MFQRNKCANINQKVFRIKFWAITSYEKLNQLQANGQKFISGAV